MAFLRRIFGEKQPPNPAEEHYRAGLRLQTGHPGKGFDPALAVQELKQAIETDPDNPRYHHGLGETYLKTPTYALIFGGDFEFDVCQSPQLALGQFQEAIRLNSSHGEAHRGLARAHSILGEKDKALEAYQEFLRITGRGGGLIKQELRELERALERPDPDREELYQARRHLQEAVTCRNEKRWEQAFEEYIAASKAIANPKWLHDLICELGV